MSYTVLARKYRPQTFADLVGQEHVARTLGNAIAAGRVAHAFLFTGVRGVGKTTTARILAKALNCANGPTTTPCGVCDACREITAGSDLDVLEIDGASNNGVDDVRRLQETIPFRPARDRFKVVIVDEVHMLSQGAFNAFLKTLEEPPPHVKFIFATTEAHKVPVTVRSRCQRYDFRLIPQATVAARVREILAAEGIEADEHAVRIVAREAAGSMRDALTLLDQVVALSGGALVGEEVERMLGIADREILHTTAAAVLDGDGATVLGQVDLLAQRGLDLVHFARSLVELFRDLVVLRVSGPDTTLVQFVAEERARAVALASRIEPLELQRAFHGASVLVDDVARAPLPRPTLEMGLVRLATRPPLRAVADLVARLESLESRLGSPPARPRETERQVSARASARETASRSTARARSAADDGEPEPPPSSECISEPPGTVEGRVSKPGKLGSEAGSVPVEPSSTMAEDRPSERTPSPRHTPSASSLGQPGPEPTGVGPKAEDTLALWSALVAALLDLKPALGAVLRHAAPRRVDAEAIVLAFPPGSFLGQQAGAPEARAALADVAERRLGARPRIELVSEEVGGADATIAAIESERERARMEATRKKALNHPLVVEALRVFAVRDAAVDVWTESDETH